MKNDQVAIENNSDANSRTVAEALNKLKENGYQLEFRRETTCLYCLQLQEWILPGDFIVDKYYYFEDILNPDAERMLYAISLTQGGKGFLVETCNAYADNISPVMVHKLKLDRITSRKNDLANADEKKKRDKLINEALAF